MIYQLPNQGPANQRAVANAQLGGQGAYLNSLQDQANVTGQRGLTKAGLAENSINRANQQTDTGINRFLTALANWGAARQQKYQADRAASHSNFFGAGGGAAVGSLVGAGVGAVVPGASPFTAALGAGIGGSAGSIADAAGGGRAQGLNPNAFYGFQQAQNQQTLFNQAQSQVVDPAVYFTSPTAFQPGMMNTLGPQGYQGTIPQQVYVGG